MSMNPIPLWGLRQYAMLSVIPALTDNIKVLQLIEMSRCKSKVHHVLAKLSSSAIINCSGLHVSEFLADLNSIS